MRAARAHGARMTRRRARSTRGRGDGHRRVRRHASRRGRLGADRENGRRPQRRRPAAARGPPHGARRRRYGCGPSRAGGWRRPSNCRGSRDSATGRSLPSAASTPPTLRRRDRAASSRAARGGSAACRSRPTTSAPRPSRGTVYAFGGGTAAGPLARRSSRSGRAAPCGPPGACRSRCRTRARPRSATPPTSSAASPPPRRCDRSSPSAPVAGSASPPYCRTRCATPPWRRVGGRIMVAGGTNGVRGRREVLSVDPATHRVRVVARLPAPCRTPPARRSAGGSTSSAAAATRPSRSARRSGSSTRATHRPARGPAARRAVRPCRRDRPRPHPHRGRARYARDRPRRALVAGGRMSLRRLASVRAARPLVTLSVPRPRRLRRRRAPASPPAASTARAAAPCQAAGLPPAAPLRAGRIPAPASRRDVYAADRANRLAPQVRRDPARVYVPNSNRTPSTSSARDGAHRRPLRGRRAPAARHPRLGPAHAVGHERPR